MTMGARLDKYLQEKKISQAELERLSGVKQQTISYLIKSGAKSSSYAIRIATALGVNPAWLQEGAGSPHEPTVTVGHSGVSVVRSHWIPVLMNQEVAAFLATGEAPPASRGVSVCYEVGDKAFCMEVSGRSMEPRFLPGDEIIVDPSVNPVPGTFVIAQCDDAVMLRKYRGTSASTFELVALNPDFPAISSLTPGCRVLGTVVERREKLLDHVD